MSKDQYNTHHLIYSLNFQLLTLNPFCELSIFPYLCQLFIDGRVPSLNKKHICQLKSD